MVQLPKLVAESDEMPHLDALRFFAAMGIVVFHFKGHLPLGGAQASFTTLRLLVDLFFVISGFVITYVYSSLSTFRQYRRFLVKRVARLWPLHLATASAMAAVGALVYFGVLHSDHRENYDLTR
ncbi:MAG: acyltransferase family protein, partial [Terriglobales bacterium]